MPYSKTYQVEVEFTEKDENGLNRIGTIEIPYMSSAQFFRLMDIPEIKGIMAGETSDPNSTMMILGGKIADIVCPPGTLDNITPQSGIRLMGIILDKEAETLGLKKAGEPSGEIQPVNPSSTSTDSPGI
jgi:hypothetical protein